MQLGWTRALCYHLLRHSISTYPLEMVEQLAYMEDKVDMVNAYMDWGTDMDWNMWALMWEKNSFCNNSNVTVY